MRSLKLIRPFVVQLARRVWRLPQTFAHVRKQRRHRSVLDELEVERLDRIRNPSKYIGR